jgi:lipopolysaccharide exporter
MLGINLPLIRDDAERQTSIASGMSGPPRLGIGTRSARGVLWAYSSFIGGRFTSLVATAILARLLVPGDFGLVALALIFMTLLDGLSDLGVSQALVVVDEEEELERAETVFVWNIVFGGSLSLLTAALGPAAALFFHQPELTLMLPVLGLRFFLRSFGATHYALAQKWIDFRPRTIAELSETIMRGLTGIGLALAGLGAWSLVIAYLAGTLSLTLVLWMVVPWRPRLKPTRSDLPQLLRFGGTLTAVDILAAVQSQTDYVFVGRFLGTASLGLYTLAYRLPTILLGGLTVVAGRVLFPAFAAIDRVRLSEAFQLSLRYMLMFTLPLSAALVVLAEPLTIGIFGDKWHDSVEPMRVLALSGPAFSAGIPAGTVFKSLGRASVLLALGIPRTILLIAAMAIFVHFGIVAVAAVMTAVVTVFAGTSLVLAAKLLQVRLHELWSATWPALVSTAGMVAVLLPIAETISSPWPALVVGAFAGTTTYLLLLFVFAREALGRLRDTAFPSAPAAEAPTGTGEPELVA